MADTLPARDLTRTTLGVLFVVLLTGASLWILRPFLLPMVWGATIAIATWPVLTALQARLWDKRSLATAVMVIVLLALFVIPVSALIGVILAHAGDIGNLEARLRELELPPPPEWLAGVPLAGAQLAATWEQLASGGPEGLAAKISPHAGALLEWLLDRLGRFGVLLFDFLLTTLFAGLFYARGEVAAGAVRGFAGRLAGPQGEQAAILAGRAIRSVALGVVVTALVQAIAGGIGLAVAGVPQFGLLIAVMFLLSVAQIGAAPVLVLAALWLVWREETGWGIALGAWALVVGSLDNVLRPILIKRGADVPLLVIFAGVLGGLMAFGVIGIFVGPVLLSVTYTLIRGWVRG